MVPKKRKKTFTACYAVLLVAAMGMALPAVGVASVCEKPAVVGFGNSCLSC